MEFENAKSFLSKEIDGQSLYDHLSGIIKKILDEKPDNALDLFENISLQVKQDKFQPIANEFPLIPNNQDERLQLLESIQKTLEFYGKKMAKAKKSEDDENEDEEDDIDDNEEENELDVNKVPNILENTLLLEWSGIKFTNKSEIFELQESIIKFIKKRNETIESSRFFGKINGIYNDYWIIECKLTEYPEISQNVPIKQEAPGVGSNEFVYYVTTNLISGNWEKLPDLNPEQLKQSRNVYRLFTGNLDQQILGQTYFSGLERDLLRCQISRIVSSCTLAPSSLYNPPEEEDEENPLLIELNEEFEGIDEPNNLESWVHQRGHLRLEGRYVKSKTENDEENEDDDEDNNDKEEKKLLPEDLEEQIPILRNITEDISNSLKPVFIRKPPKLASNNDEDEPEQDDNDEEDDDTDGTEKIVWNIREINGGSCYSVISLNNKLWIGAKCLHVKNTKNYFNIYVGNGMKYCANYYTPNAPNVIIEPFKEMITVENEENEDGDKTEENNEDGDGGDGDNNNNNKEKKGPEMVSIFDTTEAEVPKPPTPPPEADGDNQENEDE